MALLDFAHQQVLVVGGSTGIGNAIAQAFRAQGAAVHVTGTRPSALDYSAADISDLEGLGYSQLDLADAAALGRWHTPFESLNVLVLCHAFTRWNHEEYRADTFRKVVEINLNSVFDCAERFRPLLRESQGSITIVNSVAAFRTLPGQPAYTASKSALLGLIRALAMEYIRDGIRVNGLAPGLVETKMGRGHENFPEMAKKVARRLPIGRMAEPREMSGAVLFLSSPLASYVLGQTLVVDGGMMLLS
jgi:3-oxoacyl-[acyl-carrier protein] reductase